MKKENKEAIKSSVLVAVAYASFVFGITTLANPAKAVVGGIIGCVIGLILGLLTTWYPEE